MKVTLRTAVLVWLAVVACEVGIIRAVMAEPARDDSDVWTVLMEAVEKP